MSDAFGTLTGWIVLLGGISLVAHGLWKSAKSRKLSDSTTATMALGFALAVMIAPSIFYPELKANDLYPFFWISATLLGIALIFSILARRSARHRLGSSH